MMLYELDEIEKGVLMPEIKTTIKDAAAGKGVFTLVERKNKAYIHYNLPQGYILFAVRNDDPLAMEINNHLADVLEAEHGKATREALAASASGFANEQRDYHDPEGTIEQMIHEVAYERVKHSYLFNTLRNDAVDRKADELAAKIGVLVEEWITTELEPYAEQQ